ncbi:MAG: beta-N-acetylhexosaminidase [Archangium sp.]|nr:beta-N-acetylhexosaminidase [Archangium sp.]
MNSRGGFVLVVCALSACAPAPSVEPWDRVLPTPTEVFPDNRVRTFDSFSNIGVNDDSLLPGAKLLGAELRRGTEWQWPVSTASSAVIRLELDASLHDSLGDEGYELVSSRSGVVIRAANAAGVFWGTQTLRQLLPVKFTPGAMRLGTGAVRDVPRFAWRGLMVDVARHFFELSELKRLVNVMARYKLNRLHLHLTDDQGWRLESQKWPALNGIGAATEVGGTEGGQLTRAEYSELVAYAAERFITVVPELDLPGHTNAALASIPELNCDGVAPPPYIGTMVGFSSLCASRPETARFIRDVIDEVAALTPGPWIHIGGDEARSTSADDYTRMIQLARAAVEANGKQLVGWEELANADAGTGVVVQHWIDPSLATRAVQSGAKVILSPARRVYFDMQYAVDTPRDVGTFWAGYVDARLSFEWDPAQWLPGVSESSVLGVEGAVWTEFIDTNDELETMIFPRLIGVGELGWAKSPDWRKYSTRLGTHVSRITDDGAGVKLFLAPQVPWAAMSTE